MAINRIVAGTPEKVADAVGRWIEEAGSSRVNLNLTLGDMPNWKVVKNTTLFAEEVIPRLRATPQGRRRHDGRRHRQRAGRRTGSPRSPSSGSTSTSTARRRSCWRPAIPTPPPLVFLHGAGTFHGWAFAEPWTERYRVLIPHHPGYGESGDLDGLRDVHDLVLHDIELFDQLGLTGDVNLVGFSLGGLVAARFAIEQKHRLRRLVLVAPAGLRVPGVDVDDLFRIPPEELPGRLVHRHGDAAAAPARPIPTTSTSSSTATARPARRRSCCGSTPTTGCSPAGSAASTSPTLVVWGDEDRLLPVGARRRRGPALLPQATVATFPDAGHLVLDESPRGVRGRRHGSAA